MTVNPDEIIKGSVSLDEKGLFRSENGIPLNLTDKIIKDYNGYHRVFRAPTGAEVIDLPKGSNLVGEVQYMETIPPTPSSQNSVGFFTTIKNALGFNKTNSNLPSGWEDLKDGTILTSSGSRVNRTDELYQVDGVTYEVFNNTSNGEKIIALPDGVELKGNGSFINKTDVSPSGSPNTVVDNGLDASIDNNPLKADTPISCSGGVCFTAGTLIHTINGLKPIETVERGELVWSREEFGKKYDYRPVIATKVTPNAPIFEVKIQHNSGLEETFNTTEEHPFWIDGLGWRKASILEAGMKLLDKRGNATATVISQTALDETDTVYNFEVQDFSTYHIGELGIWVHNANCCDLEPIIVNGKKAEAIGTGGNKIAYAIDDKTVIAKLKPGKKVDDLYNEVKMLEQLDDLGFPVVKTKITSHEGTPALIMDRYAQGSKDIVAYNSKTRKVELVANADTSLLNANSVRDLQAIRASMVNQKVKIDDLQFLISKDGRVVISDPLEINLKTKPSPNNLRMIDLLIKEARNN